MAGDGRDDAPNARLADTIRCTPHPWMTNDDVMCRCAGIVNLTADMLFPEISLDTHVPKYKSLARKQSSVFPIYQAFYH
jgi:hypothetical protein